MPHLFISRLLETFFRRWWLYLLALVPFLALGVFIVVNTSASYRSSGTIKVNPNSDAVVNQLTTGVGVGSAGANPCGSVTCAVFTSQQINTVLGTDKFLRSVIDKAGLQPAIESGAMTAQTVRKSVSASPLGEDLVSINAAGADPGLSRRLAEAVIASYREWETKNRTDDIDAAVATLNETVKSQAIVANDATSDPTRSAQANAALVAAKNALDRARQQKDQAAQAIKQRLPTIDAPKDAVAEPRRKKGALTLVLFFTLGLLVAAAALVAATLLDRSVRYGEEIETHLHVPVLATVPDSPAAMKPLVL